MKVKEFVVKGVQMMMMMMMERRNSKKLATGKAMWELPQLTWEYQSSDQPWGKWNLICSVKLPKDQEFEQQVYLKKEVGLTLKTRALIESVFLK